MLTVGEGNDEFQCTRTTQQTTQYAAAGQAVTAADRSLFPAGF